MNLTRLLPFLLIVAGALALTFTKRKPVVAPPPGVPRRLSRSGKLNTPINDAHIKGRRIIKSYPRRPGAPSAGIASFVYDWGGVAALAKTVGYWIPVLKNELRARKPPDPFRARSKKMLGLIDDYLARG